jgi:hypothetical protein
MIDLKFKYQKLIECGLLLHVNNWHGKQRDLKPNYNLNL